jgi:hypothetical protein
MLLFLGKTFLIECNAHADQAQRIQALKKFRFRKRRQNPVKVITALIHLNMVPQIRARSGHLSWSAVFQMPPVATISSGVTSVKEGC